MERLANVTKALKGIPKKTYSVYVKRWGASKRKSFWAGHVKAYNKDQAKTQFYANRGFRKLQKGYVLSHIVKDKEA